MYVIIVLYVVKAYDLTQNETSYDSGIPWKTFGGNGISSNCLTGQAERWGWSTFSICLGRTWFFIFIFFYYFFFGGGRGGGEIENLCIYLPGDRMLKSKKNYSGENPTFHLHFMFFLVITFHSAWCLPVHPSDPANPVPDIYSFLKKK